MGAQFGVLLVRQGPVQVEVATFRSDHQYRDGRRPTAVTFERDPKQDALRRDFTINALMMDPDSGAVLDFVRGTEDLKARMIRAVGDPAVRFREDYLRMLRAVRFAARLGFTIEPETFGAIRELRGSVQALAAERVRDELTKMITGPHPRRAFELLSTSGLLDEVLPEVARMKGVEQPPEFHPEGDVWTHTMIMLEGLKHPSAALAFGVLLHDVGKPATFERAPDRIRFNGHVEAGVKIAGSILDRLRFPNEDREQVLALIANHMKFKDVPQMKESRLKRFMRQPRFEEHLALHRLDCLASHGNLGNYEYLTKKFVELPPESLRPAPLMDGNRLIAAGYLPGPSFKAALHAVEEAQLNGEIQTEAQAFEIAQSVLGPSPGE